MGATEVATWARGHRGVLPWIGIGALGAVCIGVTALAVLWHGQLDAVQRQLAASKSSLAGTEDTLASTEASLAVDARQLSSAPQFQVVSFNWAGSCDQSGCPASGTFRNAGGRGSGVAIFTIYSQDRATNYGSCSTTIPEVPMFSSASASCTITNGELGAFLRTHSGKLPLTLDARTG